MNIITNKTLELVFSSKRNMPPHLTSSDDRTQTFLIDFDGLNREDDQALAAEAWGSYPEINSKPAHAFLVIGEDVMVGSFIFTKLGGIDSKESLIQKIIETNIDMFPKEFHKGLTELLQDKEVKRYLDYCSEFGEQQARK